MGISDCESGLIDGTSVASDVALAGADATMPLLDEIENMEEMSWVEEPVTMRSVPVSRGPEADEADADRSIDDKSIVEGVTWESTLETMLITEEAIDASVMRSEVISLEPRVSD